MKNVHEPSHFYKSLCCYCLIYYLRWYLTNFLIEDTLYLSFTVITLAIYCHIFTFIKFIGLWHQSYIITLFQSKHLTNSGSIAPRMCGSINYIANFLVVPLSYISLWQWLAVSYVKNITLQTSFRCEKRYNLDEKTFWPYYSLQ